MCDANDTFSPYVTLTEICSDLCSTLASAHFRIERMQTGHVLSARAFI